MLTVGRYRIAFGRVCWFQTHRPTTVRRILWLFWIIREARPGDIDKKQRFPLGTPMMVDGTRYHYYKAERDIVIGSPVDWYETVGFAGPECGAWKRYIEADKQARGGVPGGGK